MSPSSRAIFFRLLYFTHSSDPSSYYLENLPSRTVIFYLDFSKDKFDILSAVSYTNVINPSWRHWMLTSSLVLQDCSPFYDERNACNTNEHPSKTTRGEVVCGRKSNFPPRFNFFHSSRTRTSYILTLTLKNEHLSFPLEVIFKNEN